MNNKMKQVSQKEFYDALELSNKKGLDPMPQRNNKPRGTGSDWICKKTHKIFGRSILAVCPNKNDQYFLLIEE